MRIEQEVGKGHIEPAIYITPYLKMREKAHIHTSKRSDKASLRRVCSSCAFPNSMARLRGRKGLNSTQRTCKRSSSMRKRKEVSSKVASKKVKKSKNPTPHYAVSNAKCRALSTPVRFGVYSRSSFAGRMKQTLKMYA